MLKRYWKQTLFFIFCFAVATSSVWSYYHFMPYMKMVLRAHNVQRRTEQLAAIIAKYQKGKFSYQNLEVGNFENVELPKGLYRHINDKDLEDIESGRIEVFSGTTSRYEPNFNAFIIRWNGLTKSACSMFTKIKWNNVKNARLVGVVATPEYVSGDEPLLYNGCPGGEASYRGIVGCRNGKIKSFPFDDSTASAACECFGDNCSFALKYM